MLYHFCIPCWRVHDRCKVGDAIEHGHCECKCCDEPDYDGAHQGQRHCSCCVGAFFRKMHSTVQSIEHVIRRYHSSEEYNAIGTPARDICEGCPYESARLIRVGSDEAGYGNDEESHDCYTDCVGCQPG